MNEECHSGTLKPECPGNENGRYSRLASKLHRLLSHASARATSSTLTLFAQHSPFQRPRCILLRRLEVLVAAYGHITPNRSFELRRSQGCWPSLARLLSRVFRVHVDRELHCRPNRLLNDCCNTMFARFRSYHRGWKPGCTTKIGFAKRRLDKSFDHSIYPGG